MERKTNFTNMAVSTIYSSVEIAYKFERVQLWTMYTRLLFDFRLDNAYRWML